jgi:hypothetical protein
VFVILSSAGGRHTSPAESGAIMKKIVRYMQNQGMYVAQVKDPESYKHVAAFGYIAVKPTSII